MKKTNVFSGRSSVEKGFTTFLSFSLFFILNVFLFLPTFSIAGAIDETKLTASDADKKDLFGSSVSISGDYVIIGSPLDDKNSGSAYIFRFDGSNWTEQARLTASDATPKDLFGSSVSISGDYVIIGSPSDDKNSGSAYIFKFDGSNWTEQARLTASDADKKDRFGSSVSIYEDYVIIGSPSDDRKSGSAYIFRFNGSNWTEQTKLTASDVDKKDRFGSSVSISVDYVIIGSPSDDRKSGSAYIFRFDGSNWTEQAKLTASDVTKKDRFGSSVFASGNYVIIGSPSDDKNSGSAYVFKFDGSDWTEKAKLTASDADKKDRFGSSVSISVDYVIIGSPSDDKKSGSAYTYNIIKNLNEPPVAAMASDLDEGYVPFAVTFDASASYDPDGIVVDYQWDFDSNGESETNGVEVSHTFTNPGNYEATLTVTDDQGKTGTVFKTIIVFENTPPALNIDYPANGSIILNPRPIITVYYSDNESGIDSDSFKALLNSVDVSNRFSIMENIATFKLPTDLSMSINILEVSISDLAGNTKTAQSTFNISRIMITSPFDNEILSLPHTNVTGLITDGASDAGIIVNDYYHAQINGNSFFANNIPLSAGKNDITVTVTEPNGTTDSTTITVNVDLGYTSEWIDLTITPESGIVPLEVNLTAYLHLADQIQSSRIESDGPGSVVVTYVSDTEYNLLFVTPGVYTVTYVVTDNLGVEHEQTILVNVLDRVYLDGLLQEKWYGMTQALQNGNVAAALEFFETDAQQIYNEQFTILAPVLSDIAAEFNTAELVLRDVIANTARYYLLITRQGVDYAFIVYFVKEDDGSWKIWRF